MRRIDFLVSGEILLPIALLTIFEIASKAFSSLACREFQCSGVGRSFLVRCSRVMLFLPASRNSEAGLGGGKQVPSSV